MGRGPPHFWVTTFDLFVESVRVASLLEFVVTTGVVGRFYYCAVMWFFWSTCSRSADAWIFWAPASTNHERPSRKEESLEYSH